MYYCFLDFKILKDLEFFNDFFIYLNLNDFRGFIKQDLFLDFKLEIEVLEIGIFFYFFLKDYILQRSQWYLKSGIKVNGVLYSLFIF